MTPEQVQKAIESSDHTIESIAVATGAKVSTLSRYVKSGISESTVKTSKALQMIGLLGPVVGSVTESCSNMEERVQSLEDEMTRVNKKLSRK